MAAIQYMEHLYSNDLEGYIQVLQLNNGQVLKILNTQYKGIKEVIQEQEGQEDTYISPNSFYKPMRSNENIRHYRALYIDLDLKEYSKTEAQYEIYILAAKGKIPKPTMIVDSGRGLHLYWRIEHAPKGAAYTWQELEDYLYSNLKPLGADLKATDSARVLRLPSTINSKNNSICEVLEVNDHTYSMYELREKYLHYQKKDKQLQDKIKDKPKQKISRLFNSYTLHLARAQDIETLCKLRDYKVTGYRNSILHCYTYWKGIYTREIEGLKDTVESLNDKFTIPLKDTEVKTIIKSTSKAIEQFINYEQGIRSGDDKRVSKAMKSKGGYWYSNDTLINMLNITEQEQEHLKTIIGSKEKNRRKTKARYKARRNEQGLTSREQQKIDTINKVKELSEQGLNQVEIAKEIGITQQYVSKILISK